MICPHLWFSRVTILNAEVEVNFLVVDSCQFVGDRPILAAGQEYHLCCFKIVNGQRTTIVADDKFQTAQSAELGLNGNGKITFSFQ